MFKKAKLIVNFYMVFVMTLSVALINYVFFGVDFFNFWWKSAAIGLPLAIIYTTPIKTIISFVMPLISKNESGAVN